MIKQEKFKELVSRLNEIDRLFLDQNLIKDHKKYKKVSKERKNIKEKINKAGT